MAKLSAVRISPDTTSGKRGFHSAIEAPIREANGVAFLLADFLANVGLNGLTNVECGPLMASADALVRLTRLAVDGIDRAPLDAFDAFEEAR